MNNKICLITGCNTGIGKETAIEMAKMDYKVLMLVRNSDKSKLAFEEVKSVSKNKDIELYFVDLSSQKSIREAVDGLKKKHKVIDVLINNAGVIKKKKEITGDCIEFTLAVNYFATFLLTNLLLPLLEKSQSGRIINLSSEMYKKGKIDIKNIKGSEKFNGNQAYSNSKLLVAFFTKELSEKLKDKNITVNCVHPGVIGSDVFREYPKIVKSFTNLFTSSVTEGAKPSVYLATSQDVEGVTGKYYYKTKIKPYIKLLENDSLSKKIWEESLNITNL